MNIFIKIKKMYFKNIKIFKYIKQLINIPLHMCFV